jgi:hypothetical protein
VELRLATSFNTHTNEYTKFRKICLNQTPVRYLLAGEHPQDGHFQNFHTNSQNGGNL